MSLSGSTRVEKKLKKIVNINSDEENCNSKIEKKQVVLCYFQCGRVTILKLL